jgi:hypothetical protein
MQAKSGMRGDSTRNTAYLGVMHEMKAAGARMLRRHKRRKLVLPVSAF